MRRFADGEDIDTSRDNRVQRTEPGPGAKALAMTLGICLATSAIMLTAALGIALFGR